MILFSPWFLTALVYGGLVLAAAGAGLLAVLLVRDVIRKTLW